MQVGDTVVGAATAGAKQVTPGPWTLDPEP